MTTAGLAAGGYTTTATYERLAERVRAAQQIVIVTHAKPDGDAVGSVLALHRALSGMGKAPIGLLMGPVEPALLDVAAPTPLVRLESTALPDDADLVAVVDTGSWAQLEPLGEWLRGQRTRVIGLDHHARGDDVAPERIVDPSCASCTQVIVPLLERLGVRITGEVGGVGEAIFMGLATDTGWFRFSNANSAAFALAARLLEAGVDKSRLYQVLEETARPERLALLARVLASLELVADGAGAIMSLEPSDFAETGGSLEDMTGLVNEPLVIGSVRVSALLTQTDANSTKVSFRSKPAITLPDGRVLPSVNVSDLSARFGGGGHANAAGVRLAMPLQPAIELVRAAMIDVLRG